MLELHTNSVGVTEMSRAVREKGALGLIRPLILSIYDWVLLPSHLMWSRRV